MSGMSRMFRTGRGDLGLALACSALCFVPYLRLPAALILICLLPGMAFCRHRLGETSWVRSFILGGPISLMVVPALAIPLSLIAGRPTIPLAVGSALVLTTLACLRPVAPDPGPAFARGAWWHLGAIAGLGTVGQVAISALIHPGPDTLRWRGLPDMIFFNGIYRQIVLHTPPLDPENGAALLVHNWLYHFHFALAQIVSGMPIPVMQRVMSFWMAMVFLGMVYLVCHDALRKPFAGLVACLLIMTSGEILWLWRSVRSFSLELTSMSWPHSPLGVTLLIGWYNLAPLATALAAWYWFEKHRLSRRPRHLAASIAMCAALAFFHPIFFGVFMIGFCLWLGWLWLNEGPRPERLAYLLTPLPFFVFYKLPYYGLASPPMVVHPTFDPAVVARHASDLLMSGGIYLALGFAGVVIARKMSAPLAFLILSSIALRLLVRAPNPHWFNDLLYIALAINAGLALAGLHEVSARAGWAAAAVVVALAVVPFVMQARTALTPGYVYSADERAAGDWLRENTDEDDLVAVLPNSMSSYTVLGLAGRRVAHGWTGHLLDFHDYAGRQESEIRELFTTSDPARATALATRYQISWVYLGPLEREAAISGGPAGSCFVQVFSSPKVEVRAFTCRDASAAPT